jgi:hypothetical protein
MLNVDYNNNIALTRGDSLALKVTLIKDDTEYTPSSADTIRFAVSKSYEGMPDYELKLEKEISPTTLELTLTAEETAELFYGRYNYDIELTLAGTGAVYTFISAYLTITGECE